MVGTDTRQTPTVHPFHAIHFIDVLYAGICSSRYAIMSILANQLVLLQKTSLPWRKARRDWWHQCVSSKEVKKVVCRVFGVDQDEDGELEYHAMVSPKTLWLSAAMMGAPTRSSRIILTAALVVTVYMWTWLF